MKRLRIRGVLLAAGRGERLRPLTDLLPKPLLPVAGRPLANHSLASLAALGCEAVAINLHHLGDEIRLALGDRFGTTPLTYSPERELLGTLGALTRLRHFLAPADLAVVVNGDTLCRWPLKRLVRRHLGTGAAATLLFASRAEPWAYGGGVALAAGGRVRSFRPPAGPAAGEPRRVFAGVHVFAPALLDGLGEGPADTVSGLWQPLLERGESISAVQTARPWHDLGTPGRLLRAARGWAHGPGIGAWLRRNWIGRGVELGRDVVVRRAVVDRGCQLGPGCRVDGSLLLPGARLGADCWLQGSIVGPGVSLPPGTAVQGRLVTPERAGVPLRPGDSCIGGLVYTPIR